uniref:Syntaxin 7 n=1 Tax=Paramormyrops kingsleyae TaxID=1676925 RepID=A0A3B3Q5W0_9TELE
MAYQFGVPQDPNQLVQEIGSNIHKITQQTSEIQRIINLLGSPQDTAELRQQLQQKQHNVNQLAKETDRCMKEFGSLPVTTDQRQRKLQKDRLVNDFSNALANFQKTQRQAAEKEKEFVARVRAGSRLSVGHPDESFGGIPSPFDSESQSHLQVQEESFTEDDLRLIEERESAIRQLETYGASHNTWCLGSSKSKRTGERLLLASLFAEVRWMLLKVAYIPVRNLKCAGLYGCHVEFLTPSFCFSLILQI